MYKSECGIELFVPKFCIANEYNSMILNLLELYNKYFNVAKEKKSLKDHPQT